MAGVSKVDLECYTLLSFGRCDAYFSSVEVFAGDAILTIRSGDTEK